MTFTGLDQIKATTMIKSGLVSVTFRQLAPAAIVDLACQAKIAGIEWGGDIHVPHGDLKTAEAVARLTRAAGLAVAAYGSYYKVGHSEAEGLAFANVLATAKVLGAPVIRVWAGNQGAAQADAAYREKIRQDARRLAELAAAAGLTVAFEYHSHSLTDTAASTRELLEAVQHPALKTCWQPLGADAESCRESLRTVLPRLANLHVYHWNTATGTRLPLKDGADAWRQYLDLAGPTDGERYALLEFVRDDSPAAFLEDAQTLNAWVS